MTELTSRLREKTDTTWSYLAPMITKAAAATDKAWPGVSSPEDLEQGISVRILERSVLDTLAELDPPMQYRYLRRIGTQIVNQDRKDYDFYSGNYFYSAHDVRGILKRGVLHQCTKFLTDTERMDVEQGMAELTQRCPRAAEDIRAAYLYYTYKRGSSHGKNLTDAVNRLAAAMNQVHNERYGIDAEVNNAPH